LCASSHDYQGDRPLLATVTKAQRKRQPTFYVWPKLRVRNGKGASNWTHVLAIFAILCWGMADGELPGGPQGALPRKKHSAEGCEKPCTLFCARGVTLQPLRGRALALLRKTPELSGCRDDGGRFHVWGTEPRVVKYLNRLQDRQRRKHQTGFDLPIKNESVGIEEDQIPS